MLTVIAFLLSIAFTPISVRAGDLLGNNGGFEALAPGNGAVAGMRDWSLFFGEQHSMPQS